MKNPMLHVNGAGPEVQVT